MKAKRLLLVAILLLGVGFASVSTTLIMTGNVKIATNDADFDVRFTKAILDGANISSTIISADGKIITFGTKDLSTVGDKSILNFEVINNSEMYDAEVSIECSATGDKNDYYQITKEVATPILAKTKGTGKVEVALIKATTEDIKENFTCTLKGNAKERTTKAETVPTIIGYAPKYFSVGVPTTSSTTDFTTLGKNLFIGLDEDGSQLSICIRKDIDVVCLKNDDYDSAVAQIKEVLGADKCRTDWSYIECSDGHFTCGINSTRALGCTDLDNPYFCRITQNGSDGCN